MNWPVIGEIIKAIAPLFTAGAACTGAWIAWRGLEKWRIEIVGKQKAELAVDVLADFYRARDIILSARNRGAKVGEGQTRLKNNVETEQDTKKLNEYYRPLERLKKHEKFFSSLSERSYRFKAQFREASDQAFSELEKILLDIELSCDFLISEHGIAGTPGHEPGYRSSIATIWSSPPEEDEILKRLDSVVSKIENICFPAIEMANK